jgi:hypothetical protein
VTDTAISPLRRRMIEDMTIPNGQKIDTRGSGVPPIFEWQIASYDRPPSGERFENFSMRSVQIRAHDCVRSRSALLAYQTPISCFANRPFLARLKASCFALSVSPYLR